MTFHKRKKIAKNITVLLKETESQLSEEDSKNARELLEHGEWGEALDLICTQLYEYDTSLSSRTYKLIEETAELMGLDRSAWSFVENLCKSSN